MLKYGFLEDFKGADTLLVWGDDDGLAQFGMLLRRLASRSSQSESLQAVESAIAHGNIRVEFRLSTTAVGGMSMTDDTIVLACSPETFAEFGDKVAALIAPGCGMGHQYLDAPGMTGRQVIVSKGEYPEGFGT